MFCYFLPRLCLEYKSASCLSEAEGTENFADEQEIRGCFIEAGFTGGGDDNQDDEDENEDDDDENENEDVEETN
jgi:hypothetical protein